MPALRSYVVRYDSGFAPNPFHGYCTLATCKPEIRRLAQVGDWIIGCGSNDRLVRRGGSLVYAMCVGEILNFRQFDTDLRFLRKKPFRRGSRMQSCGDNIYFRDDSDQCWLQRDSFHTADDGSRHAEHVEIDTAVDRVLVSQDFVYFGGEGPDIPPSLHDQDGRLICKSGIGQSKFEDPRVIAAFVLWIRSLGVAGLQGVPFEWMSLRAN